MSAQPIAVAASKDEGGENFPVGSFLLAPRHRPVIFAFYRVARMSDDIADHATLSPGEKLARLDAIAASIRGESADVPEAVRLRAALAERQITDAHVLDLLEAFRRDVTKTRYATWDELMDYCRYSACPVGRFMLDVHGENRATWAASDALCSALQVINHLQDCAKDYREIDRVYIPEDALAGAGLTVEALAAPKASPQLKGVINALAARTLALVDQGAPLPGAIKDFRLRLEVGVIHSVAQSLTQRLMTADPLSEKVHHSKVEMAFAALRGVGRALSGKPALAAGRNLGHKDASSPGAPS
ncbi:MAG: squalene synthase HpnC [Proteobacteria bacterium]|nr:squalene synthase HpnC [Pseudomonadota bacterium]